jgi:hypothetical protein
MHRKLAALTGGLALAFTFAIPAAANAATVRESGTAAVARPAAGGCGGVFDQGNGEELNASGINDFCNVSIPINGEFEMVADGTSQCLAVNSSDGDIDVDSAAACTSNGGEGDSWDRWTAIKESGPGVSPIVWEFKNQFFTKTSECMYDDTQPSPIYAACNNSDVFEWWTWPGSNL